MAFLTPIVDAKADPIAIGSGYFCSGITIVNKRNKTVKLSVAKRNIQDKITALGNSSKNKSKRDALKAIKASLTACSNGTFLPGDIAGTYTGTLTRTSAAVGSSLCEDDPTLTGSFLVQVDGAKVFVTGAINPFHIPVSGARKGNEYVLTGRTGSAYRSLLTLTLRNVSDISGDFSAVSSGSTYSPVKRKFVTVCQVHYEGTGFTRVK